MADAIIGKVVKQAVGLAEGGTVADREVLAIYRSAAEGDVFALCRNGLLLRQGVGWRFIDNGDIEEVDLPIGEVKTSTKARRLVLVLRHGERVDVPVDGERDGFLDVFPIHAFVRRRVHQHKALDRKG